MKTARVSFSSDPRFVSQYASARLVYDPRLLSADPELRGFVEDRAADHPALELQVWYHIFLPCVFVLYAFRMYLQQSIWRDQVIVLSRDRSMVCLVYADIPLHSNVGRGQRFNRIHFTHGTRLLLSLLFCVVRACWCVLSSQQYCGLAALPHVRGHNVLVHNRANGTIFPSRCRESVATLSNFGAFM